MTAKDLLPLVGRRGRARLATSASSDQSLDVDVEVIDARRAFGRLDLLVRPLAGAGEAWMAADRVSLQEDS